MFKIDFKDFKLSSSGRKRLFLLYGITNFLITNSVLHLLLLVIPIFLATIASQITNLIIGFYLYGKKVFKMKNLTYQEFRKYILLASFNWTLNYVSIRFMYEKWNKQKFSSNIYYPFSCIDFLFFSKKIYIY